MTTEKPFDRREDLAKGVPTTGDGNRPKFVITYDTPVPTNPRVLSAHHKTKRAAWRT